MRQYLFELRKQADMTQKNVSDRIYDRLGIKIRYGDIERGNCWAEISPQRAKILAEALRTSAEYILTCEKNEGGYVGEGHSGSCENHQLRVGKYSPRNEYSEPLSRTERDFADKYYPYACKVIRSLERREFFSATEHRLMDSDDFTDVGAIAFLKSVKYIFSEHLNDREDGYLKGIISYRIKWGISKHIKSLLHCDKRKADTCSLHIEEKISENSDDCFYEYIPDTSLPVAKAAESSCMLSCLYSHLSAKQCLICRYLILGYSRKELTVSKKFSETDIGILIFYLDQIRKFGKILWDKLRYVSGCKGVGYCFDKNKWLVTAFYHRKNYNLGYYDDLLTAIDVKESAEYHCCFGDFLEWYDSFKSSDRKKFVKSISAEDRTKMCTENQRHSLNRASIDDPVGISYRDNRKLYEVTIKGKYLGMTASLKEAVALRNEAEDHILEGDFDNWLRIMKNKG